MISEIESFRSLTHLKVGFLTIFIFAFIFFLFKNFNQNQSFTFKSNFNYVEGLEIDSDVSIAGISIGKVTKLELINKKVIVHAFIKENYKIPLDSIITIRSDGIFGKKSLLIEPGFGDLINQRDYVFTNTKDSYSLDMFLRYLNNLNE
tara:strand:+ start:2097 stop:2540 length:444 start_codon:yes stop_codon:yes gene_type:complete